MHFNENLLPPHTVRIIGPAIRLIMHVSRVDRKATSEKVPNHQENIGSREHFWLVEVYLKDLFT